MNSIEIEIFNSLAHACNLITEIKEESPILEHDKNHLFLFFCVYFVHVCDRNQNAIMRNQFRNENAFIRVIGARTIESILEQWKKQKRYHHKTK